MIVGPEQKLIPRRVALPKAAPVIMVLGSVEQLQFKRMQGMLTLALRLANDVQGKAGLTVVGTLPGEAGPEPELTAAMAANLPKLSKKDMSKRLSDWRERVGLTLLLWRVGGKINHRPLTRWLRAVDGSVILLDDCLLASPWLEAELTGGTISKSVICSSGGALAGRESELAVAALAAIEQGNLGWINGQRDLGAALSLCLQLLGGS